MILPDYFGSRYFAAWPPSYPSLGQDTSMPTVQDILAADSAAAADLTTKQAAVDAAQSALAQAQADLSTAKSNDAARDADVVSMLQALGTFVFATNPDGTPIFNNDGSLSVYVLDGSDPKGFKAGVAVGGNTPVPSLPSPPAAPPASGSGDASTPPDTPVA